MCNSRLVSGAGILPARIPALALSVLAAPLFPAIALAADSVAPALSPRTFENVLICGALLALGLYHLTIFVLRRNNRALLWLAVYCCLRAFYSLCAEDNGQGILQFLPGLDPDLAFSVGMIALTASSLCLQAFFRDLFPRQFPRWGLRGLCLAALAWLAAGAGFGFDGPVLHAQFVYLLAVMVYTLVNLARAWRDGEPGAAVLLAGYGALTLCGVNDVLQGADIFVGVRLTPIGTLAFVLAQSCLLAHRFSQAFAAAERLSARLETQNTLLEKEIARRNWLERKLDTIGEDERRFISRTLHDGLCQELTAARLRCSLWQSTLAEQTETEEFRKLSELLESAVDQAYELSRGLWPLGQDIGDLPGALRELGETLAAERGIAVSVRCAPDDPALTRSQNEHIFLIAKEALRNVAKHARARHAGVELSCPDGETLRLVVEDDGIGLDAGASTRGGLGTKIMAHHAQTIGGTLTLSSPPEGGSRVELTLTRPA